MTTKRCDRCGTRARIAGGIGDMWNPPGPSGGMTLEFDDGTEAFLCFSCIEELPDEPTTADLDAFDPSPSDP